MILNSRSDGVELSFHRSISSYFKIEKFQTSVKTEILAGTTTFVALAYIVAVNPAILSDAGIPFDAVLFATVFCSALSCIMMGLWANKPFALAPGMGMNGYIAYYVVKTLGIPWQTALGVVFFSGMLSVILTLTPFRNWVIDSIPLSLKKGIAVSIGVFIAFVGLRTAGILEYDGVALRGVGSVFRMDILLMVLGITVMGVLHVRKIHASVLVGMSLITVAAILFGISLPPHSLTSKPRGMLDAVLKLDFVEALNPKLLPIMVALFVIDFFSTVGTFVGVAINTNIVDDQGRLPRLKEALLADSIATPLGALCGTSNVTTYVESAAGVQVGGRTGITALVVAAWLLPMLLFSPVLRIIPNCATAAALIFVGILMAAPIKAMKSYHITEKIAFGVLVIATALTFSIDQGMLYGFSSFILLKVATKKWKDVSAFLYVTTGTLVVGKLIQLL